MEDSISCPCSSKRVQVTVVSLLSHLHSTWPKVTPLRHGIRPRKMQSHLIDCFSSGNLLPFPLYREESVFSEKIAIYSVHVPIIMPLVISTSCCPLETSGSMIQCDNCEVWYTTNRGSRTGDFSNNQH